MKVVLRSHFIVAVVLFFYVHPISAQEKRLFKGKRHRIGFVAGVGARDLNGLFNLTYSRKEDAGVSYNYHVTFFQGQYYYVLLPRRTWSIDILAQPQYNITKFRDKRHRGKELHGFEFGLNAGVLIRKNFFNDLLSLYGFISSGPHYISGAPERQSSGFIFSDNFFIGLNIRLLEDVYLDLRPGFRHISNAGLTKRNAGINNLVFSGGFFINL